MCFTLFPIYSPVTNCRNANKYKLENHFQKSIKSKNVQINLKMVNCPAKIKVAVPSCEDLLL